MKFLQKLGICLLIIAIFTMVRFPTLVTAESTFDQIRRTGVLRIAAYQGGAPQSYKDLKTGKWGGFVVLFGKDLAKEMGVKCVVVESPTAGQAVLDLQVNKLDITFTLTPTPRRMLSIDFARPVFYNTHIIINRPGFDKGKTWDELNDPKVRIAVDIGTSHEMYARQYAPKAKILAYNSLDQVIMAVLSNRADCFVNTVFKGLAIKARNPKIGKVLIPAPSLYGPVCPGLRRETDHLFRDFVSNWVDYNRGLGNIKKGVINELKKIGIQESDVPPNIRW